MFDMDFEYNTDG